MRKEGFTLLQTLLSLFIGGLVCVIVFQQLLTLSIGQQAASDTNMTATGSRQELDTLADHLRSADSCTNSAAGVLNSVVDAATATSLTYYGDSACTKVRYFLTNGTLSRTDNGVTTIVARNVSSLSFTYYKAATYNSPWTTTTLPNAPTAAELPYVCGVLIDVTTTYNGVATRMQTTVRMRNAPKKISLDGL
ncbi:PulJ/GspJ family protein [Fimbriimonas ginsengisoli]|uniref:Uncharacterized protein n=1 Tax=Fimbriimonas ginsengisoli Gsoil 348 TaxID=661478 RepID=A0A068NQZ0_FIMGI|nr:hypothetical protein [Fimbriimonas ginsengisoli]AIE83999.1 hypothetical protein OP10G_0631 [Fimbriimonas ginsengisoli Gsoil 348]